MQSFWMRRSRSLAALGLILLGLLCWPVTLFLLLDGDNSQPANAISVEEVSQGVAKREESLRLQAGHTGDEGGQIVLENKQDKLLMPLVERQPHGHPSYIHLEGVDAAGNDLFLVHGADLSTLKSVCSSLDACVGFNSEGWMKGRIVEKKRSELDLYLKQSIRKSAVQHIHQTNGSVEPVDEGAGVFAGVMAEYSRMEKELKIYMYETDVGLQYPSYKDYKYGVEDVFRQFLAKSKFRTKNPAKAHFFFIPSRCTAYRKSERSLQQGIEKAAQLHRDMVDQIQHTFPYWNQSLGTDHFYVCAHDMGTEVVKFSIREAWKNSIGLVNTAEYSEPYFIPHKDISVPPHPGRDVLDWSVIGQGGRNSDPSRRTTLAFMAGNAKRGVRPVIYEHYDKDRNFKLVKGQLSNQDYFKGLLTSKFCLCPRGFKGWSPRVMDALWFGCVPVFLADYYHPPLAEIIPWQDISLSIPESQIDSLGTILEGVSEQRLAEMQHNIAQVYHHLTWHDPPRPYDAFYGVLFQLWQRRNVHRTKPYSL